VWPTRERRGALITSGDTNGRKRRNMGMFLENGSIDRFWETNRKGGFSLLRDTDALAEKLF